MKQNKPSKQVDKLENLFFDLMLVGLPKDCAWVGDTLICPPRTKVLKEKRGKDFDKAIKAIRAYYKGLVPEERIVPNSSLNMDAEDVAFMDGEIRGWNQAIRDMLMAVEES